MPPQRKLDVTVRGDGWIDWEKLEREAEKLCRALGRELGVLCVKKGTAGRREGGGAPNGEKKSWPL